MTYTPAAASVTFDLKKYGIDLREDGFGVEPDDYLVGIVAPDGTFVEPLHIR